MIAWPAQSDRVRAVIHRAHQDGHIGRRRRTVRTMRGQPRCSKTDDHRVAWAHPALTSMSHRRESRKARFPAWRAAGYAPDPGPGRCIQSLCSARGTLWAHAAIAARITCSRCAMVRWAVFGGPGASARAPLTQRNRACAIVGQDEGTENIDSTTDASGAVRSAGHAACRRA